MIQPKIANPVAVVVGQVLGAYYYSHRRLNHLFVEKGAPGEPPEGNCEDKCIEWLKRASGDNSVDAFSVLGGVLEELMEVDRPPLGKSEKTLEQYRQRVRDVLGRFSLSYHTGGRILSASAGDENLTLAP